MAYYLSACLTHTSPKTKMNCYPASLGIMRGQHADSQNKGLSKFLMMLGCIIGDRTRDRCLRNIDSATAQRQWIVYIWVCVCVCLFNVNGV